MNIVKYRAPHRIVPQNSSGGIDYTKLSFNFVSQLKDILKSCLEIFENFKKWSEFTTLPISITYSKLVPKTSRVSKLFKLRDSEPFQIGSEYIFSKDAEDIQKIRIVYECGLEDVRKTYTNLSQLFEIINKNYPNIDLLMATKLKEIKNSNDLKSKQKNQNLRNLLRTILIC
ncbi:hypothetical protein SCLARK_00938 [Spiroplasma clarkii]|uniref:hypothetical protein n=1 Tax=Spiroplasma clarkii TaxID=2139 RepID=UPI000B57AEE7|nr:hypothetical protein [Spiroplasma clarkii]ARU91546.1 hypothetical protein SCLARK_00938 [Spiroplasma clarkii]